MPSLLPTIRLLTSCLHELLLYFNLPSPLSAAWMCMGTGFSNKSMGSLLGAAICGLFPSPLGCQLPITSFSARRGTWDSSLTQVWTLLPSSRLGIPHAVPAALSLHVQQPSCAQKTLLLLSTTSASYKLSTFSPARIPEPFEEGLRNGTDVRFWVE